MSFFYYSVSDLDSKGNIPAAFRKESAVNLWDSGSLQLYQK